MSPFSDEARKNANQSQREKYGAGYSQEMARRNSLRKKRGTGANSKTYGGKKGLSKEMSRRAKLAWEKRNNEK